MTSLCEATLGYRRLGWDPIPLCQPRKGSDGRARGCHQHGDTCDHPGKTPLVTKWTKLRNLTETDIARWERTHGQHNVGLLLGAGIATLDVDPRNGGAVNLERIEFAYGPLPSSAKQVTPSGGWHLFGRYDPSLRVRKYTLAEGLDFLAEGSQVVAAPSIHTLSFENGQTYSWEDRESPPHVTELPEFPAWILQRDAAGDSRKTAGRSMPHSEARGVLSALATIPPEDRTQWLCVAMAMKEAFGEDGWPLLDAWSSTSTAGNYDPGENRRQWDSIVHGDGTRRMVTEKTLFFLAHEHGWTGLPKASAACGVGTANDWKPPVWLDDSVVPAFPVDALGGRLAEWTTAVSDSTQTPPDLAAMLGLTAAAASVQGCYRVHVGGDWTEALSLYVAVALQPGERKTAVLGHAVKPIEDWEAEARKRLGPVVRAAQCRYDAAAERVKATRKRYAGSKDENRNAAEQRLRDAEAELNEVVVPVVPRVLVDDATPESAGLVITFNGGRIAALTDEGGLFETLAGRYSDGVPNLDLFLKGYDGTSAWRRDRVKAPSVRVKRPAITLGLAIQPEVVCGLGEKRGFRGRGLIGRFAYSIPTSALGSRKAPAPPVPPHLSAWYDGTIRHLLDLPYERDDDGEIVPAFLELTREARDRVYVASAELEPRLGPGGDLAEMSDWAGKSMGRVVRIAALLHLLDAPENVSLPISAAAVSRALQVGEYLLEHARAAFDLFGLDEALADARALWRWVEAKRITRFAHQQAWQALKQRFKKAKRLDQALVELEERGYIASLGGAPPGERGGRPARGDYAVNPLALLRPAQSVPKTPETSTAPDLAAGCRGSRGGSGVTDPVRPGDADVDPGAQPANDGPRPTTARAEPSSPLKPAVVCDAVVPSGAGVGPPLEVPGDSDGDLDPFTALVAQTFDGVILSEGDGPAWGATAPLAGAFEHLRPPRMRGGRR